MKHIINEKKSLFYLFLSSLLLGPLSLIPGGCSLDPEPPDGEYDTAFPTGKADSPYSECELATVAAYVSNPAIGVQDLTRIGVHSRAARNLVAHRIGPDGLSGTEDDDPFEAIEEVDDVSYVGPVAMGKLVDAVRALCQVIPSVDVVFSPQAYDSSHLNRTAQLIDGTNRSIDIAMYSMGDNGILEALKRAVGRGVSVRMVFEPARQDQSSPAGTWSQKLEDAGIDVRYINKVMHHKFVIIDGPRDTFDQAYGATLVTGSGNWSNSAGTKFDENTAFIQGSGELAMLFQKEFNLLWENSRDFTSGRTFDWLKSMRIVDPMIVDFAGTRAHFTSANFKASQSSRGATFTVISGSNAIAGRLVELIQSATRSIHIASGHMRSRPVAEALLAKHAASPEVDIKIYLDQQEYISQSTSSEQQQELEACLAAAGESESARRECMDSGYYFSYDVYDAGIPLRFKFYAYRWDYTYAVQMHHKTMVIDGQTVASGSYNLSDNAEHNTMENMVIYESSAFPSIAAAFEENFASMWETGRQAGLYEQLVYQVDETTDDIPLVFPSMALDWEQVTQLKTLIRQHCPAVDSMAYRASPASHQTCPR